MSLSSSCAKAVACVLFCLLTLLIFCLGGSCLGGVGLGFCDHQCLSY